MEPDIFDSEIRQQLFADRYRVERLVGKGGMGRVYLAQDTMLSDEQVALKVLSMNLTDEQRYVARFLREVQLTRKVSHPNVVRTYEVGRYKKQLYYTMEYIDGKSMQQLLPDNGTAPDIVARIAVEICRGLGPIHEAGIVHRDLKPGNILVTVDGQIKITDFGIARPALSTLTSENEVIGSAPYMAPEIWLGNELTSATDIYALGVLCYEFLTGILPFDGEGAPEVMCKHLESTPIAPMELSAEIPKHLSDLVLEMLSKNPADRPRGATQLAERIENESIVSSATSFTPRYETDSQVIQFASPLEKLPPGIDSVSSGGSADSCETAPAATFERDAVAEQKDRSRAILNSLSKLAAVLLSAAAAILVINGPLSSWSSHTATVDEPHWITMLLLTMSSFVCGAVLLTLPISLIFSLADGLRECLQTIKQLVLTLLIMWFILGAVQMTVLALNAPRDFPILNRTVLELQIKTAAVNVLEAAALSPIHTEKEALIPQNKALRLSALNISWLRLANYLLSAAYIMILTHLVRTGLMHGSRKDSCIDLCFGVSIFCILAIEGSTRSAINRILNWNSFRPFDIPIAGIISSPSEYGATMAAFNWLLIAAISGTIMAIKARQQLPVHKP